MDKTFKVAQVRDLLNQVNNEQITFSRFVEILNEQVDRNFNSAVAIEDTTNTDKNGNYAKPLL